MFSEEEIQALVLGSRWVAERADSQLGQASAQCAGEDRGGAPAGAAARIRRRRALRGAGRTSAGYGGRRADPGLRTQERKLRIAYRDENAAERPASSALRAGLFDRVRIVAAWCELRQGFRHFGTGRIVALAAPGRPLSATAWQSLLKTWRALMSDRDAGMTAC